MDTTPITLLERLSNRWDQEAWARFVELYTPLIFDWCRRTGLQVADAADLTQDVFSKLLLELPEFSYNQEKSFRAWLRTLTLNLWRDRQRRVSTRPLPGNDKLLNDLPAHPPLAMEDKEYYQYLVNRALRCIQVDFQPKTWQAFWQHAILGVRAEDVAKDLGISVASVYCGKLRVLNRLRQELNGFLE